MNWPRTGNLIILVGLACILSALAIYLIDFFGNDRVLPAPVALNKGGSSNPASTILAPTIDTRTPLAATGVATVTASPAETNIVLAATPSATSPMPTITPTPAQATAKPDVPVRLVIASIDVDSAVQEVGTYWENGQLLWETVPFIVGHYRTTAKAGAVGNAVFSGHVTSRSAGNVFRDLYKIQIGDEVHIYTVDARFVYVVTDVRLVLPTETSVMDPTEDATATLITCAGEWNETERSYSHRLIVTTKLKR